MRGMQQIIVCEIKADYHDMEALSRAALSDKGSE